MSSSTVAQFSPFSTSVSPSFWSTLAAIKIDKLQLSDENVPVRGHYEVGKVIYDRKTDEDVPLPAAVSFDGQGLIEGGYALPPNTFPAWGTLKNFNTIEEFKTADKQKVFNDVAQEILDGILTAQDPTPFLTRFLVLSFADLKKYKFVHWFGFPALVAKPGWELAGADAQQRGWKAADGVVGRDQMPAIGAALAQRRALQGSDSASAAFFLARRTAGEEWQLSDVTSYEPFFANVSEDERIVGFVDPSPLSDSPGWPLRNLLALLSVRYGVRKIRVVAWKDPLGSQISSTATYRSRVAALMQPEVGSDASNQVVAKGRTVLLAYEAGQPARPNAVGWERNSQGKLAPKMADLSPLMDPKRLADQAVDLNLKLMRWRIMPDINLEKIHNTKCLLLGAGTLGCYVARTLMGWGVRHITLLDSSRVSFSNPVRQPLFDFEDCLDGGKPKAECAAAKLSKIYPGVEAKGIQMSIPMPGHPVPASSLEQTRADVRHLEQLIDEHDVVYLLMDSRESRWLPTLLGAAKNKLLLNAALGFDSYLVMRHGASPDVQPTTTPARGQEIPLTRRRLGCYYCNDIVAPADSLTDRTLDQMCTVTRPGLAAIAGASAVELMVSVLQHKDGILAPASTAARKDASTRDEDSSDPSKSGSVLGLIPHQIRGFLAQFSNLLIVGQAYERCTACSPAIVEAYRKDGFDMLLKAFNDEVYLEKITGLDKLKAETEALDADLDWSGSEAEEGDGELL
ncbi:putative APG7-component of the autophagic system [Ceraceosorus guamensis]|uniref:Ubiquitin-like modifier-activating enzyme ATG7 n=1 Tax=Ceraceosorus guamensis TaxID=1522189 RepID=A0A316W1G2_9BASI|nr:putative APG7-component of the autophagic system [Ceraceosorus guamensis]PWN43344.1 putative APG7-component of the autophagic system [Ceraceosorus guamensis]